MTFLQHQNKLCHCTWMEMKLFVTRKLWLATKNSHLKDSTAYFFSCTLFDFVIVVKYFHVAIAYDCLDILHAAVTHFNYIFVEYLFKDVVSWKMGV